MTYAEIDDCVRTCLREFLSTCEIDDVKVSNDLDLIKGTGFESADGVEFACELSDALGIEVPHDFNPFVCKTGKRGMKVHELVSEVAQWLKSGKEVPFVS